MYKRKTIVLTTDPAGHKQAWGSLRVVCNAKGWVYNTCKRYINKMPYNGHQIERVPYNGRE